MPFLFFDSSALAKRYVAEGGSSWVEALMDPPDRNTVYIASITAVEVMAALARRGRTAGSDAAALAAARVQLRQDLASPLLQTIELTAAVVTLATDLAERHALRGYDSVQLAAAIAVARSVARQGHVLTLVSADDELNAAAGTEGLAVDNPLLHP